MTDELYRLALDTLKKHLEAAGVPYSDDDGDLLVAGHRLGFAIGFESFAQQGDQTIAPLDVQIHLDGDSGDRFRVGTLGVGDDRPTAIRSAIEEWHLLAASAVLAALGAAVGRRRSEPQRKLGGWDLFPGRAGLRGTLPAGLTADGPFYRKLLDTLRKVVVHWPKPAGFELRSIFIMVSTAEGSADVQAAIDGLVDAPLAALLTALEWPCPPEAVSFQAASCCGTRRSKSPQVSQSQFGGASPDYSYKPEALAKENAPSRPLPVGSSQRVRLVWYAPLCEVFWPRSF